jgi:hypothetical protein
VHSCRAVPCRAVLCRAVPNHSFRAVPYFASDRSFAKKSRVCLRHSARPTSTLFRLFVGEFVSFPRACVEFLLAKRVTLDPRHCACCCPFPLCATSLLPSPSPTATTHCHHPLPSPTATTHCHRPLPTAHCPPPTAHRPLPTASGDGDPNSNCYFGEPLVLIPRGQQVTTGS